MRGKFTTAHRIVRELLLSRSASDDNCRFTQNNIAAVGGRISHAGRGKKIDHDRGRPIDDDIRRTNAGSHVCDSGRRQKADQDSWAARAEYRPADMGDGTCRHWANVHISNAGCRRHISDAGLVALH